MPEREMDLEECETVKREQSKLRILEWICDLPEAEQQGQTKQEVGLFGAEILQKRNHSLDG